jgi:hypothetical protein
MLRSTDDNGLKEYPSRTVTPKSTRKGQKEKRKKKSHNKHRLCHTCCSQVCSSVTHRDEKRQFLPIVGYMSHRVKEGTWFPNMALDIHPSIGRVRPLGFPDGPGTHMSSIDIPPSTRKRLLEHSSAHPDFLFMSRSISSAHARLTHTTSKFRHSGQSQKT